MNENVRLIYVLILSNRYYIVKDLHKWKKFNEKIKWASK